MVVLCGCQPEPAEERPNILFIMSDDHAANAIPSYGSYLSPVVKTPNLDRIASEGARLNNVFCTNSICAPSRATILTGQYSHSNGVYTLHETLKPEQPNVAKEMQRHGYQTAIIGKWHLKADPSGFDYWNVMRGQGRYVNPRLRARDGGDREYAGYSTDVVTDLCIRWLEERDPQKPFFLMCHYKAPHDRWTSAERFDDWYREEQVPEPPNLHDDYADRFSRAGEVWSTIERMVPDRYLSHVEPEEVEGMPRSELRSYVYQKFIRQYLRTAQAVDDNVGRLLDVLDQRGLADDTVVIYTSDQGVFIGEHGYFDKRFMYEESLRMPFLVRYPREIRPGTVVDELVENTDFAPLFVDYADAETPDFMQGESFRSLLRGDVAKGWKETTYYRYWMHMSHFAIPAHYGIRTKRFKLIYYYGEPLGMEDTQYVRRWKEGSPRIEPTEPEWELFDLERDPHEMNNVYADPEYAEELLRLKEMLLEKKKAVGDEDDRYPVLMAQRQKNW
jgi:arylsulfatase A-like enzyme